MSAERKQIDWERIESDYRVGLWSLREIAASHGNVTEGAIRKRAKRDGWVRDLGEKVKSRADDMVRKDEVRSEYAAKASEKEIVEANATRIAQVRIEHRKDISRFRKLALDLLAELEAETGNLDLFEELGDFLRADDDKAQDKRNELYRKVISGAGRIDSAKKLAETLKTLIGLEREAYGIGTDNGSNEDVARTDISDTERARRIAFALQRGLMAKENQK
jgi:hypothetical protein